MFGYVCINESELKVKDWRRYKSYYCGMCNCLHKRNGRTSQLLLNYDLTFLAILLSGLYEPKEDCRDFRCLLHPTAKRQMVRNDATDYCADMTVLLAYHQLLDGYLDDKNIAKGGAALVFKSRYKKIKTKYERQVVAIETYVRKLHAAEQRADTDLDMVANLTGEMLGEIFAWKYEEWKQELRDLGFYFGKFIYLMDAYEDMEKDRKNGHYNILLKQNMSEEDLEVYCQNLFPMIISEGAKIFERLPIIQDAEILRNIMYAGIWCKYVQIRQKRRNRKEKEL
ncbi:MAG: hypothetical protein E7269_05810 [Lachnospiraceae bacterium]|nr:hypothetical protein [Lachnospiraceae bacterium]